MALAPTTAEQEAPAPTTAKTGFAGINNCRIGGAGANQIQKTGGGAIIDTYSGRFYVTLSSVMYFMLVTL